MRAPELSSAHFAGARLADPSTELRTDAGERLTVLDEAPLLGGEARVYAARAADGRRVAIKLSLLPASVGGSLAQEGALLRELGEDPAAASHVARVHGGGLWAGRPFLVLDWYPHTLATWCAAPRRVEERLAMALHIAEAVAALAEARPELRHRDIKPSNLLVDHDGSVRIGDFGAARDPLPGATTTTTAVFTERYSAPELRLGLPVRAETHHDVYALGATVYHALVGRAPHAVEDNARKLTPAGRPPGGRGRSADVQALLHPRCMVALTRADRVALRRVVEGPVVDALALALEPVPERRRQTARGLAEALRTSRPRRPRRLAPLLGAAALACTAAVALAATAWPAPVPYASVLVPGGTTRLGDPEGRAPGEPARVVTIEPFVLGVAEVDQALWRDVTGDDPASFRTFDGESIDLHCTAWAGITWRGDTLPVVCVDFAMAARFANALSERDGLAPAYTFAEAPGAAAPIVSWDRAASGWRLPTGEEWEHAARAGRAGPWDVDEASGLCAVQNGADRSFLVLETRVIDPLPCDDGHAGPAPVTAMPPNAWGLRSMAGNVHEWVWEPRADGLQGVRGGSYSSGARDLRSSFTARRAATLRGTGLGLRLARRP